MILAFILRLGSLQLLSKMTRQKRNESENLITLLVLGSTRGSTY